MVERCTATNGTYRCAKPEHHPETPHEVATSVEMGRRVRVLQWGGYLTESRWIFRAVL